MSNKHGKHRRRKIESHIAGNLVKRYRSVAEAAKDLGVKYTTFAPMMCRVIANDWMYHGFRWRRV